MEERRESPRKQADWLADIYADDTIYTSPVRNLSQGGAEFIRPQLWKPKKDHFCKVCFSDMIPSHTFEARMQICWITDFSIGMKYHDIKFKERIRLNKILSRLSKAAAFEDGHFVM